MTLKRSAVGNKSVRVVDEKNQVVTVSVIAIRLDIIVQFLHDGFPVVGVADILGFDYNSARLRDEVFNRIAVCDSVSRILRNKVRNPWAKHKVEHVLNSGFAVEGEHRTGASTGVQVSDAITKRVKSGD